MSSDGEDRAATGPTSAFTVAKRVLGDLALTVGQLAQLRAIDHKYQQSLFTMLGGAHRAPTHAERSQLDAMAERDILEMLTPAQRLQLRRK